MADYLVEQALFSEAMRQKLRANGNKSLKPVEVQWCLERCASELIELSLAVGQGEPLESIVSEAVDVANFAMFVAIKSGGLQK